MAEWNFQTGDMDKVSAASGDLLEVTSYVKVQYVDSFVAENGRIGLNFVVLEPEELRGQAVRDYFGQPTGDEKKDNRNIWPFWKALMLSGKIKFSKGMKLNHNLFTGKTYFAYFVPKTQSSSGYNQVTWLEEGRWNERAAKFKLVLGTPTEHAPDGVRSEAAADAIDVLADL